MYRLIYLEPDTGYRYFDSPSGAEIDVNLAMLHKQKISVICVVDYAKQAINNKCLDYSNHYDSIDGMIFDPIYVTQF
jgi:hypothetical protein